jgi:hypothetical protein
VCAATLTQLDCFEPAPDVGWLLAHDRTIERRMCLTNGDEVACGFHCAETDDHVACAATPEGACFCAKMPDGSCTHRSGRVTCFDPPYDDVAPLPPDR